MPMSNDILTTVDMPTVATEVNLSPVITTTIGGPRGPVGPPGDDGAGGIVDTIVPGTGIDVDATDPANPIVSVEGGPFATTADITAAVLVEENRAETAEATLTADLATEVTNRTNGDTTNANAISTETTNRTNADSTEVTNRIAGDAASVSTAASDATTKANAAQAAAIAAAATDATTKANAAVTTAEAFSVQRANHTGTQTASTISDLIEAVQDIVGAFVSAGSSGVTVTYNDPAGTLIIDLGSVPTGSITGLTEAIQDTVGAFTSATVPVTVTYDDTANTLLVAWSQHDFDRLYKMDRLREDAYRSLRERIANGSAVKVGLIGGSNVHGEGSSQTAGGTPGSDNFADLIRLGIQRWRGSPDWDLGFLPAFSYADGTTSPGTYFFPYGFGHNTAEASTTAPTGCTVRNDVGNCWALEIAAGGTSKTPTTSTDAGHGFIVVGGPKKSGGSTKARLYVNGSAVGSQTDASGSSGYWSISYTGDLSGGWWVQNEDATGGHTLLVDYAIRSPVAISTGPQVLNAGWPQKDATDFIAAGSNVTAVSQFFTSNPCDHYVVSVGLNAAFASTPVATFRTNLQQLLSDLHTTNSLATFTLDLQWRGGLNNPGGGVVKVPPSLTDWLTLWHGAVRDAADYARDTLGVGCDLWSTYDSWGNLYDGTSTSNAGADVYTLLWSTDHLHPNAKAYKMAGYALVNRMLPSQQVPANASSVYKRDTGTGTIAGIELGGNMRHVIYKDLTAFSKGLPSWAATTVAGVAFDIFGDGNSAGNYAGLAYGSTPDELKVVDHTFGAVGRIQIAPATGLTHATPFAQAKRMAKAAAGIDLANTGTLAHTYPLHEAVTTSVSILATGTLFLFALEAFELDTVASLTMMAGGTGITGTTHLWAVLCDANRVVRAVTTDDTSATWTAGTEKTFTFAASYQLPTTGKYFGGIMFAGTTPPFLRGKAAPSVNTGSWAVLNYGPSNTGQTTPPTTGTTMNAISAQGTTLYPYAYLK